MRKPYIRPIPSSLFDRSIVLERGGVAQPAQNFYMYWISRTRVPREIEPGRIIEVKLCLIGPPTTDARVGDLFTVQGTRYEVVYVQPVMLADQPVMRVMECASYG
jgi:hypothetical protein